MISTPFIVPPTILLFFHSSTYSSTYPYTNSIISSLTFNPSSSTSSSFAQQVFRLPLNLLVVIGTKLTNKANDIQSLQRVFIVLAAMHGVAMLLQLTLQYVNREKSIEKKKQ